MNPGTNGEHGDEMMLAGGVPSSAPQSPGLTARFGVAGLERGRTEADAGRVFRRLHRAA
jgi:hypothetical protein